MYVSSHINAVPYLALAIEECWLSAQLPPGSSAAPRPGDSQLIRRGCPAQPGVETHWEAGSSNSAFSFTVSEWIQIKDAFTPLHCPRTFHRNM